MSYPDRDQQLDTAENPSVPSKRFVELSVDWAEPVATLPEPATAGLVSFSPRQRTLTELAVVSPTTRSVTWFLEEVPESASPEFEVLGASGSVDVDDIEDITVTPDHVHPFDGVEVVVTLTPDGAASHPSIRLEYPRRRHLEGTVLAGDRQGLVLPDDLSTVYAADELAVEAVSAVYEVEVRKLNNR